MFTMNTNSLVYLFPFCAQNHGVSHALLKHNIDMCSNYTCTCTESYSFVLQKFNLSNLLEVFWSSELVYGSVMTKSPPTWHVFSESCL